MALLGQIEVTDATIALQYAQQSAVSVVKLTMSVTGVPLSIIVRAIAPTAVGHSISYRIGRT